MEMSRSVDPWFGALARLTNLGVLMVDPNGTIEFASDRALALFDCDNFESVNDCLNPVRKVLVDALRQFNRDPDMHGDHEAAVSVRVDGQRHQLVLEAHPIHVEHCRGALVLVRDETAQRQLEEDLRLASRFRNIARLYRAFAHDLRTPVAAVQTYLELLGKSVDATPGEKQQKQREYVNVIVHEIEGLRQSLELLLDELAPRENEDAVNVREVVETAQRLIRPMAERHSIELDVELAPDEAVTRGQRNRLRHAVLNLAVNAIEAMADRGGRLRISYRLQQNNQAEVCVADTGPGIPADVQTKLLSRQSVTTKQTGTGVGLRVVRDVVEMHGGSMRFTSQPGQGAEFVLCLPVTAGTASGE